MNLLRKKNKFYTKNLVKGKNVYGESLVSFDNIEYRQWVASRSKYCAALTKGMKNQELKEGKTILYLGASSGTTPSHFSDLIGEKGTMFALDFAPRVVRDLVLLCEKRKNMIPILGDASKIEETSRKVTMVDVIFQDITGKTQTKIFLDNVDMFLKKGGIGYFAVKAKSIDVTERPQKIYNRVREKLKPKVKILEQIDLYPIEKDHCMFVIEKKSDKK